MQQKTFHFIFGILTLFIFLLSGIYMKSNFPEIYAENESIRYQYRANHIYILLTGLINLMSGLYPWPIYNGWRKWISRSSSLLIIISPLLLIAAFFIEPGKGLASRPLTATSLKILLIGCILAQIPAFKFKKQKLV